MSADSPLLVVGPVPAGLQPEAVCATLGEATARLAGTVFDAVLIVQADAAASLATWPGLSQACLDAAVLLVTDAPTPELAVDLLARGVQAVLATADASPGALQRAIHQAVLRNRIEREARKAYATDLATGLPNHMQLLEHMTHLVALRAREPAPMALIVLRIEGLVQTEAALGVEAANVLKRKVAVRLRSGLRASDVVASLGGDAFAVLLAWIDSPDDGERVARKLAQSLTQPFSVTGRERHIGVRVGLASYPAHGDRVEDLMRRALGQAAQVATVGRGDYAHAADRGPSAAANDEG